MKQILFLAFALSLSINSSAEVYRRTTTETVTYEDIHRTTVTRQEEVLGYSGRGDRLIPECRLEPMKVADRDFGMGPLKMHTSALYKGDSLVSVNPSSSLAKLSPPSGFSLIYTLKKLVDEKKCKVVQKCKVTQTVYGKWELALGDVVIGLKESPHEFNLLEMTDKGYCQ